MPCRTCSRELVAIWRAGGTAGVGTVVRTFSSAPRQPGAAMVVAPDGSVSGSVSGGCVEGAVYETALEVVETGIARSGALRRQRRRRLRRRTDLRGHPRHLHRTVVAQHLSASRPGRRRHRRPPARRRRHRDRPPRPGLAGSSAGHRPRRALTDRWAPARADDAVTDDARGLLAAGRSEVLTYGPDGQRRGEGMEVFVASHAPRPRMLVFGAIDFAAAVAQQGSFLGYRVTVCDARPVFATPRAVPHGRRGRRRLAAPLPGGAGRRRRDRRPHRHLRAHPRPQVRRPAARGGAALPDVGYIGAMGSRRTHDDRLARLREAGLTEAELSRLASPIGLDLGARTPGGDGGVDRRGDHRPPGGAAAGVRCRISAAGFTTTTTVDPPRQGS